MLHDGPKLDHETQVWLLPFVFGLATKYLRFQSANFPANLLRFRGGRILATLTDNWLLFILTAIVTVAVRIKSNQSPTLTAILHIVINQ